MFVCADFRSWLLDRLRKLELEFEELREERDEAFEGDFSFDWVRFFFFFRWLTSDSEVFSSASRES